jgi:hypothetical protein
MKGVIMANSLRSKIKKLCHDNNISEKMCNELLEKLEGHDRELRAKTIDEFAEKLSKYLNVKNATKYGNKNAEQQINSYDTLMKYEIMGAIDDVAEQMKAGAE